MSITGQEETQERYLNFRSRGRPGVSWAGQNGVPNGINLATPRHHRSTNHLTLSTNEVLIHLPAPTTAKSALAGNARDAETRLKFASEVIAKHSECNERSWLPQVVLPDRGGVGTLMDFAPIYWAVAFSSFSEWSLIPRMRFMRSTARSGGSCLRN